MFLVIACSQPPQVSDAITQTAEQAKATSAPTMAATERPQPTATASAATVTVAPSQAEESTATAPAQPTESGNYEGVPVGFTDGGYPYLGEPDAPVTLEEYSDYLCSYCARHVEQTFPTLMEKYIRTGKVKLVFRDLPLASLHQNSPKGHAATACVAEQGADLYWKMHYDLFKRAGGWAGLANPSEFLRASAKKAGADMDAYDACMASGRAEARVKESIAAADDLGFRSTPSFRFIRTDTGASYNLVGAQPIATFSQWIEALLAGKEPPHGADAGGQGSQAALLGEQ